MACAARALSLNGQPVWMVGPVSGGFRAMEPQGQGWRRVAIYRGLHRCRDRSRGGFLAGDLRVVPPRLPQIQAGGVLLAPELPKQVCR